MRHCIEVVCVLPILIIFQHVPFNLLPILTPMRNPDSCYGVRYSPVRRDLLVARWLESHVNVAHHHLPHIDQAMVDMTNIDRFKVAAAQEVFADRAQAM